MSTSFLQVISYLFGWIYTICWSLSFYPQPILNFRRKSTSGAAIDFPFLNVIGFAAYFVSTLSFLYAPEIKREYALRNNGHTSTVQFNDVAFAAHALILCFVIISQYVPSIWGFDKRGKRGPGARISKPIWALAVGCIIGVVITIIIVLTRQDEDVVTGWAWIDVVCGNEFV
jgi:cystinosin